MLRWTVDDWAEVDRITAAVDARFGRTSTVFGPKIALAYGWRRDPSAAVERMDQILSDRHVAALPVVRCMILTDRANYARAAAAPNARRRRRVGVGGAVVGADRGH